MNNRDKIHNVKPKTHSDDKKNCKKRSKKSGHFANTHSVYDNLFDRNRRFAVKKAMMMKKSTKNTEENPISWQTLFLIVTICIAIIEGL